MSSERKETDDEGDRGTEAETVESPGVDGDDEAVDPAETADRESMAADLRTLVERIEGIHADPYRGYDGRVPLHAALEETVRDLPPSATVEEFYRRAAPLVAGLEDAHSRLVPPEGDEYDDGTRLPVSLRVVGDALYVDGVYEESLADLLGAQMVAVQGDPVDAMVERYTSLRGSENPYFARMAVAGKVESAEWFDRLLDEPPGGSGPTVEVRGRNGETERRSLEPISSDSEPVAELDRTVELPDGTGPRYRLLADRDAAVFVPANLMYYREVVQSARDRGAEYAASIAREAYGHHFEDEPPEDVEEIVPALPSMVETLIELVEEMAAAETTSLVVDLRDNPGGDSRFVQYLGYFLYGLDTLVEGTDWTVGLKRRTEAHRERYGVPETARDEYATFEDNPAGYDFGGRFRNREMPDERRRERMAESVSTGAFAEELSERTHEGYYEPDRVVVATTAGTMSSGFAGAALLAEFGGDVVGVPSGQAPISFGEAIEVTLPNTGLRADVAGSMYRWTRDPDGDVGSMDRELTRDLFEERYDAAGDAALRLALDWADGSVPEAGRE